MVVMSMREGRYEIQTLYGKVAYIGFLVYGGVYSEPSVNQALKALGIFLSAYTVVVVVGGTVFYSIVHRYDEFSIAQRIFTLVNMSGVLAVAFGQLINTIYRERIKENIRSMDNHFYTDFGRRGMTRGVYNEALNVTRIIALMLTVFGIGIASFLASRPLGLLLLGWENMSNIFFQLNYLPVGYVEKRYGLAAAYWLTFCLTAPAAIYSLLSVVLGVLVVSVIPGTIYNNFWYLRCRIVEESEASIRNFEEYESRKSEVWESETRKVVQRYIHYLQWYQILIGEMSIARGYIEVFYSAMYAATFVLSIPGGILITTKEDVPISAIISLVSLSSATIVYIIIFAHIGTLLEEENNEIMMRLYDSPWVWLQPKHRRILITFMIMLQRPITLQIFKIRPVTVVLLLRFCQLNYTIINFFRMTTLE